MAISKLFNPRMGGRLGMANPFAARALEDFSKGSSSVPLNVSGQPVRNSAGIINRPNPIKFSNGLPQLTGFQSEAPATAGPATLGTGSFMTNAAQYLRGNPTDVVDSSPFPSADQITRFETPTVDQLSSGYGSSASIMNKLPGGGMVSPLTPAAGPAIFDGILRQPNAMPPAQGSPYPIQIAPPPPPDFSNFLEGERRMNRGVLPITENQGAAAPPTPPSDQDPYATSVLQQQTGLDPLTRQLLFGLDGQGGFIPGAMQAAERTFFDDEGRPVVVPQEVAGFTPDQLRAQELARSQVGIQSPYLQRSEDAYRTGINQLQSSLGEQDRLSRQATGSFLSSLGETDRIQRGATDQFGRRLGDIERFGGEVYDQFGRDVSGVVGSAAAETGRLGQRLGESGDLLRGTTGAYDPSMTEQFYDPYEDRVVQQTISDAFDAADKADVSQRARDIATGGESAFGSRARLGAEERREALGRGLGEALSGIRSRGFGQAQQAAMGEFGRQQQAKRTAASGLAGLAGQQYGAGRDFTGTLGSAAGQRLAAGTGYGGMMTGSAGSRLGSQQQLAAGLGQTAGQGYGARTGLGQTLGSIGAQQLGGQQGYGGFLSGLGGQAQQAGLTDINALAGIGGQQQQLSQNQLDAIRANAMQAQQAPLAQYQSLLPFIQAAPAGQFQTQTTFAPRPSPLQAGLATGLGTLGALGNFFGGSRRGGGYANYI